MKITCPSCSASYNVDSSRVPANGMTMRCPKCSHSFRVSPDGATEEAEAGAGTILDGGGQAIKNERYYVKRPTGKVFGPFDGTAVEMMLKSGKLGGDAEVSTDKVDWKPIRSIPNFGKHIADNGELPSFTGNPKSTMMGGWTPTGEGDLPAPKGGPPELPVPKGAGGPPELPVPKGMGIDLPGLKGGADLPGLKGGADLPGLKGGADLPGLKGGADLPGLKGGADLPGLKGGADLPAAKGIDLPVAQEQELSISRNDDLFGGGPSAAVSDEDLFGGGSVTPEDDDDDLFGAPADDDGDDLFAAPASGDDDLFGAPDSGAADDDLFGAPKAAAPEDDLFGPAPAKSEPVDDNDLFGTSGGGDDDLFAEAKKKTDEDDFLGGDAGFSFLDDAPPPGEEDMFADDLFGEPSKPAIEPPKPAAKPALDDEWGEELLDRPVKPKPSGPAARNDDPFRPMSSGIREEEPKVEEAPVATAAQTDDKKRGKMALLAVPVLPVVLAGVGYVGYTTFVDTGETPDGITKPNVPTGPLSVDLAALAPDNFSDYQALMDRALAANVTGADSARLAVAEGLMLSRYKDEKVAKDFETRVAAFKEASGGDEALARGAFEAIAGNADAARAYLEPLAGGEGRHAELSNLFMGIGDIHAIQNEVAEEEEAEEAAPAPEVVPAEVVDADAGTAEEGAAGDAGAAVAEVDSDAGVNGDAGTPAAVVQKEKKVETKPEKPKKLDHPLIARARKSLKAAASAAPESPLPPYWLGRLAQVERDDKAAVPAYENAAKLSPTHVASRLALGRVAYETNDLNRAVDALEKVNGELAPNASVSERAEALHFAGLVYVARRQSELAIDAFTKALSIDPSRNDTLRALAHEYESAKKYEEALNFFTTNKNLGQKEPEVMLGIVRSHIGLEQWTAAIDQLEEAQKLFAEDARFPFYLGRLNLDRGDFQQAAKAFERAVEIDPLSLRAHTALAQLAWRMDKDIRSGEEHVKVIVQNPQLLDAEIALEVADYYHLSERRPAAEQWYREANRLDPNFWPARLALARLLLEEDKFEEAKTLLEKARKEGVQDVRLAAYLADAYRQSGDFDRAIDEINKVIEQFPKNEEYIYILGRIQYDRGNYDTARKHFSRAYDLNPRYHDAYFFVGRTAYEQEDFQTALKIFRHVLDYKPNKGDYRFYMARTLEAAGRTSQALDEYRKATAVDPAYGVENPRVYIYRGRLLTRLGYPGEGRKDIARALELAPQMTDALLAMGESNYEDKSYEGAIKNFTRALQAEPEHPDAQYKLGMSLIFAAQQREGAKRLQLAIKYGYKDAEVYRTLGYLYKDLGQRSLALESFQEYLTQTQDKEIPIATRRELLRQIQELGG